ncbi:LysR family transcriptional regulator [Bacillus sp. 1NLA3E]|uniref:LysR family transcriptional regulator n=1 Tax=Bacillus sp. 1NLA3E TaxID=666686 RepID=UPI0002E1990F|nr:LysR family transcriptional regulator [Bacillus sp. 1NLA3E]
MDTIQLETFLKIIEHKNFSKAAEILNVTQPTVTARIKKLEEELCCTLFEREGKNANLTKEGQIFIEYASSILTYMNHSKEATSSSNFPKIRVGIAPGFSYSFISDLISSIISIDKLDVSIFEGKDSGLLNEQLVNGEFDLVITRNFYTNRSDFISEHLFDDKLVLICGKNHRLAHKKNVKPSDLQGETLICYQRHTPLWTAIEQQLVGISGIKRIEVGNNEMLKSVVGSGIGIGITTFLGVDDVKTNNIIVKDIKGIENIPNKVHVQYRKNPLIEQPVKKMIYSIINHEIDK